MEKRKNFTEREKQLLLKIVSRYNHIICNKKTDKASATAKQEAWKAVASTFNCMHDHGERTGKQLKTLYENLRRAPRKNLPVDKYKYLQNAEVANDKNDTFKMEDITLSPTEASDSEQITVIMKDPLANDDIYLGDSNSINTSERLNGEDRINENIDSVYPSVAEVHRPVVHPKTKISTVKTTNNRELIRKYYLKKLQLVEFELKAKKQLHQYDIKAKKLELEIKKEQLNLLNCEVLKREGME
ncbi:hypothetical protein FQR65_LT08664 [Abscondita terminalis]|nr:hypothetical protein FQR65_LT08664 [Abscondita terminalis]